MTSAPWTNNPAAQELLPNPDYGYNFAGTGRYSVTQPPLGLDGVTTPLRESQVKVPGDMVAVCDYIALPPGGDHDAENFVNLLTQMSPPPATTKGQTPFSATITSNTANQPRGSKRATLRAGDGTTIMNRAWKPGDTIRSRQS